MLNVMNLAESLAPGFDIAVSERPVRSSRVLMPVGEMGAGKIEEGIHSHGLDERRLATWPQHAMQLGKCGVYLQMMQDRPAEDDIKAGIGIGKGLSRGHIERDLTTDPVHRRPLVCRTHAVERKVKGGHQCATLGEQDAVPPQTTANLQNPLSLKGAEKGANVST